MDSNPFAVGPARPNPLAKLTPHKGRVAIYVPSTIHAKPAPADVVQYQRDKVAESLARWFGGFTELVGTGGWYSEKLGKLIRETVYVVFAAGDPATIKRILPRLIETARSVAVAMEQEAVTVEVNGALYFVPAVASVAAVLETVSVA